MDIIFLLGYSLWCSWMLLGIYLECSNEYATDVLNDDGKA